MFVAAVKPQVRRRGRQRPQAAAPQQLLLAVVATAIAASLFATKPSAGLQQQLQSQKEIAEPKAEPYSFSYSAQSTGGFSSHQESGDGSGRVSGFYTIQAEDGRERRVDYVADENGYRATVQTNEIGTRAASSADADFRVAAPSAGQLEAAKASRELYEQLEEAHANEIARIKSRQSAPSGVSQQNYGSARQQQQQQQRATNVGAARSAQSASVLSSSSSQSQSSAQSDVAASRPSREPDASDFPPPPPVGNFANQEAAPRSASWQTSAGAANDRGAGAAARLLAAYPRQQLELQFQQQAKQMTEQDYYRQPQPAASSPFENTGQFLVDEPQPQEPQPQQPQRQAQAWQQSGENVRPVAQDVASQPGNNLDSSLSTSSTSTTGSGEFQQQQDNIINEPIAEPEIPKQPEPVRFIGTNQDIQQQQQQQQALQPQRSTTTVGYNENEQININSGPASSQGVAVNLTSTTSDNQSETIYSTEPAEPTKDQQQVSLVGGGGGEGEPKQTQFEANFGQTVTAQGQQQQELAQISGQEYVKQTFEASEQQRPQQQQQQQRPNSVNQIIESSSGGQQQSKYEQEQPEEPVATARPAQLGLAVGGASFAAKGQEFVAVGRPATTTTTTTPAPLETLVSGNFQQPVRLQPTTTTTPAPTTTTTTTTTTTPAELSYTTPARFYQPATTTSGSRTEQIVIIQPSSTTPAPAGIIRQQSAAAAATNGGVKGAKQPGSQAGLLRNRGVAVGAGQRDRPRQQSSFVAQTASAERVIATTRAPGRAVAAGQQVLVSSSVKQQQVRQQPSQQQQQQQRQTLYSEAPFSSGLSTVSVSGDDSGSAVSYAGRNKTSTSLLGGQRRSDQPPNNGSIRFNSSSQSEVARTRPSELLAQSVADAADGQARGYLAASRPATDQLQFQQQQEQQRKGIKGGRARSGRQFWQQQRQQQPSAGNQTTSPNSRRLRQTLLPAPAASSSSPSASLAAPASAAADAYAVASLGYGSRVTAAAQIGAA